MHGRKRSSRKNEKGITLNNGYYKGWINRTRRPVAKYNSKILSMKIEPGRNYGPSIKIEKFRE